MTLKVGLEVALVALGAIMLTTPGSSSSSAPHDCTPGVPAAVRLRELRAEYPLPRSVGEPELFLEAVQAAGVVVHACGLSAEHASGRTVTGAAADLTLPPLARSYFELLERAAVLDAPASEREPDLPGTRQRYSASNGVAVATTRAEAERRALFELIERDRILRCFFGETRPERLALGSAALLPAELEASYDLRAFRFPASDGGVEAPRALGGPAHVAAVFGFPRYASAPLLFGFGARGSLEEAVLTAARESLQQLAFGWGEPVPDAPPEARPTPEFHLDYFAYPPHQELLRAWLDGAHYRRGPRLPVRAGSARYADVTPSSVCGRLAVIKCTHEGALPLVFGEGHPLLDALPACMRVHPIA